MAVFSPDRSLRIDADDLLASTSLMHHRGPDEGGLHMDPGLHLGLGHRRLSIISLGDGQQPMFNADKSLVVVFNGEIYNYIELREQLTAKGRRFRTGSDTEAILHGYEEWGDDCVKHFNGMFAFALWDTRRQRLFIARDPFGIKPLYYFRRAGLFACASEIKPLLHTGRLTPRLNARTLDAFMSIGYVPGEETMFEDIRRLRPGHTMVVDAQGVTEKEYWDFAHITPQPCGWEKAREEVGALFLNAVKKHLIADVPLGVFLSGGVDSSAVVAMMKELKVPDIETFTVDYEAGRTEGEGRFADIVVKHIGTRQHLLRLQPQNFIESLRTQVGFCEEPLVEAPAIALYHLSVEARRSVKAVLSGEGSDEVFAGYGIYHTMQRLERLRSALPASLLARLAPRGLFSHKHRKYLDWLELPLERRFQGTSGFLTESLKRDLYSPDFLAQRGDYLEAEFTRHFDRVAHQPHPLNKLQYVDCKTWLPCDLLLKADKMTMAASIELRVPFLDHRLIERSAALPPEFRLRNGEGKFILKSILEPKLPREILYRTKMGFPVPLKRWFSTSLLPAVKERLLDRASLPWVRRDAVENLLSRHERDIEDHSRVILTLLVLNEWMDQYLRPPAAAN